MKHLLLGIVLTVVVVSCLPKSSPYPFENPALVRADAQKLSDKLEAYVKRWLKGEVPAQIPDSLVPFDFSSRRHFYLKRPEDVTTDEMWMTRYAKPVNLDSVRDGQPDPHATYYIGASPVAPFGSKLVIEGQFPYARFFSIQVTPPLNATEYYTQGVFGSTEVAIVDVDIEPLPGSVNPYRVGADRNAPNRNYRVDYDLKIGDPVALNGQAHVPLYRAPGNKRTAGLIVYQGPGGLTDLFSGNARRYPRRFNFGAIWVRTFAPDHGKGPKGGVALPRIWYELPTGERYFIGCDFSEAKRITDATIKARTTTSNPNENFNAYSGWGKEFGLLRSILSGVCQYRGWTHPDSIRRVREIDLGATGRGEFQRPPGNYEGQATINNYCSYISRGTALPDGMVAVVTGKLPTFPDTRPGKGPMPRAQLRYFSISGYDSDPFGPLPGACHHSLMDDELLLDNDRCYVIAYSRPQDRPANAKPANGVTWVDWGPTADLALTTRWVSVTPDWAFEKSPHEKNLPWATADWAGSAYDRSLIGVNSHKGWMGCYLPKVSLMTKQAFEALGNRPKAGTIPVWIEPRPILGPNDSQGRPAVASTEENATHPASAAFDGNLTTRWTSAWNGNPQFLTVDLGRVKPISGVKLYWEFTLKAITYQLQVSADNRNWTPMYATTTGDGGIDLITNLTATGRYVRVLMSAGTFPMYALHEVEVFSPEMPCNTALAAPARSETTPGRLRLWPNPAFSSVTVALPETNDAPATLVVADMRGRIVSRHSFAGQQTDLNVASLLGGTYLLTVQTRTGWYSEKLVIGQ